MLGTLLLAATLTAPRACTPLITFSRDLGSFVAQDDYALYVRDYDFVSTTSILRIPKNGEAARTVVTSSRNIWALDVDGAHIYFGTANRDVFGRNFTNDELHAATIFGGEPAILTRDTGWIHWVGHDATHIYWFEAGGVPFTEAGVYWRIRRFDKRSGAVETVADNLHIHPSHISVALGEKNIYVEGFDNLYVIAKDGSRPVDGSRQAGAVFFHGGAIYTYSSGPRRLTEDDTDSKEIVLPGRFPHMYGIAGDLLLYSTQLGDIGEPFSIVHHICSGKEERVFVDFPGSFAILGDSCSIYRIGDKQDIVTLAGPGDFRIDSITPAHAAAGEVVTIKGSGFDVAFELTFDGVAAAAYAVDATEIKAIVPPLPAQFAANVVAVHNPDGRCTGAYFAID